MEDAQYTKEVIEAHKAIQKLTAAELITLRELLEGYYDLPPDAGVREPRRPLAPLPTLKREEDA